MIRPSMPFVVLFALAFSWPIVSVVVRAAAPVQLTVQVIHASNKGHSVDPSLAKIRSQLTSLKYTNYQLLETRPFATTIGAKHQMPLAGGRALELYPYGVSAGSLELLVTITDGAKQVLNTTFRLSNGGTLIVGGPSYGDGVVILAISGSF